MNFTINQCRVEISFLFFATLTFSLLLDRTGIAGVGLVATIAHECGHLVAMHLYRIPPTKIKLNPFGIDIVEGRRSCIGYRRDALVALAGPVINFIAFIFLYGVLKHYYHPYLFYLAAVNLTLAIFNGLPIEALDGGQALFSILCIKFRAEQAIRLVKIVSFLVLIPLAMIGFYVLLKSKYNFSLLLVALYLMALLLIKKGRYF